MELAKIGKKVSANTLREYQNKKSIRVVIGCLMKNPLLLNQYTFSLEDFVEVFHQTVYGVIHTLGKNGYRKIEPNDIASFLKDSYPAKYVSFEKHNGLTYLQEALEYSDLKKFEGEYYEVRKWSILRNLIKAGVDVSEYYDPDETDSDIAELKKDKFQREMPEDILAFYRSKLVKISDFYSNRINRDSIKAGGEDALKQKESWKKSIDFGLSYASNYLTTVTYGIRRKKFTVMSAGTGTGKAIPNYTKIPTPNGFREVGEIREGDYIFGDDGKLTKVLMIHPQPEEKEVWEVELSDGRIAECCKDHLWQFYYEGHRVYYEGHRSWSSGVMTTEELYNKAKETGFRYKLPVNKAVEYDAKTYSISPYALGSSLNNEHIVDRQYLFGSIQQRKELLFGILNIEVSEPINGIVRYSTTNKQLKDEVIDLCRGLGYVVTVSFDKVNNYYTINIQDPKECDNKISIVDIRKTNRKTGMTCFTVDNESHLFLMNDYIVTHNTRISIANICHSYAPKFYNSKLKQWEDNPNGTQNCALYIGTEMELREEIEPIIWAYMADVPEDHITMNMYEDGEEERVEQAIQYLRQTDENGEERKCGIYLEYLPEYTVSILENVIEQHVRDHGVTAVFFDYIHTNSALLAEYSGLSSGRMSLREDQVLGNLSVKLKDWTRKYNISIDTWTQVSGDFKNERNRDQTIVRGAKSIIDKCDVGAIVSRPTENERNAIEPIMQKGIMMGKNPPNICMSIYKNRGGKYNEIKIWLYIDYGTMRVHDLFVTDYEYQLLAIDKNCVWVDEDEVVHVFTGREALNLYKEGKMSKNELELLQDNFEISEDELKEPSKEDKEKLELHEASTSKIAQAVISTNEEKENDEDELDFNW